MTATSLAIAKQYPCLRTLPAPEFVKSTPFSIHPDLEASPFVNAPALEDPYVEDADHFRWKYSPQLLVDYFRTSPPLGPPEVFCLLDIEFLVRAVYVYGYPLEKIETLVREEVNQPQLAPSSVRARMVKRVTNVMQGVREALNRVATARCSFLTLWSQLSHFEQPFAILQKFVLSRAVGFWNAAEQIKYEEITAPGIPMLHHMLRAHCQTSGVAGVRLQSELDGQPLPPGLLLHLRVKSLEHHTKSKADSSGHSLSSLAKKPHKHQPPKCNRPYHQGKMCSHVDGLATLSVPESATVFTVGRGRQGSRFFITVTPPPEPRNSSLHTSSPAVKCSEFSQDGSSSRSACSSVSSTFHLQQPPVRRPESQRFADKQLRLFNKLVDSPNLPYWYRFKAPFEEPARPVRQGILQLGPIANHRLSLTGLRSLDADGLLDGVLDIIESEEATKAALKPGYKEILSSQQRVSYNMAHCAVPLAEVGVAEPLPIGFVVLFSLLAFLVPKKDGSGRFVVDASILSKVFKDPAKMGMMPMHELIKKILRWNSARIYDAVSMFYQFAINNFLSHFFIFLMGGKRGTQHVAMRLLVLCMGWSWAPLIAHTSSRVLCSTTESVPFVDNFACEGSDANVATLLERFDTADIEIRREDTKDWNAPSSTEFEHLGLAFELTTHRFSLSEKTRSQVAAVAKMLEDFAWRAEPLSATDIFVAIGYLCYCSFVVGEPPALYYSIITIAKMVARLAHRDWKRPIFLPDHLLHSMWTRLKFFAAQRWYKERDLPVAMPDECLELWTDASDLCAGIVTSLNHEDSSGVLDVVSRRFCSAIAEGHIFVKESVAFHQGFMELSLPKYQPFRLIRSFLDNFAVLFGILKGRSSVKLVNNLIENLYKEKEGGRVFEAGWVCTRCMLADYPSRENELPPLPLPRCEDPRCSASHPRNLVQPRWMTFVAATSENSLPERLCSWPGLLPSSRAATERNYIREIQCASDVTTSGDHALHQDQADHSQQQQQQQLE